MTATLDAEGFADLLGVSRETMTRLEAYVALMLEWRERINLIGRGTIDDLWRRHILDSAQLCSLIPRDSRSVIDLGSGAGLPGLVLAILGVAGVELVEADGRKCAFLREAARLVGADVQIHQSRIEEMPAASRDVVTARACAPLDRLLGLAAPFLGRRSRCLFFKGEQVDSELAVARQSWAIKETRYPSRSDPRGAILCLQQVRRERRSL